MIYIVHGISDCPACLRACADLMDGGHEYVFVNCDFSATHRANLKDKFNWPTFPIIIESHHTESNVIGGYEQLRHHLSTLQALQRYSYYVEHFRKGDLIRWVTGHNSFAAHPDRLEGIDPIFKYGVILQVSKKDPNSIIAHTYGTSTCRLIILDGSIDTVEILSKGVPNG